MGKKEKQPRAHPRQGNSLGPTGGKPTERPPHWPAASLRGATAPHTTGHPKCPCLPEKAPPQPLCQPSHSRLSRRPPLYCAAGARWQQAAQRPEAVNGRSIKEEDPNKRQPAPQTRIADQKGWQQLGEMHRGECSGHQQPRPRRKGWGRRCPNRLCQGAAVETP